MTQFDSLDLNLLRTLDALLAEGSVTGAAHVLGRSQPAVSHALARLREALDDPLLVREGNAMVPTPRAAALQAPLASLLADLRRALAGTPEFDPETDGRTFTIASPDLLAPLVPDLLAALAPAPRVRVELVGGRGVGALDRADLLLDVLPEAAPGVISRRLGSVTQAVIARAGHPALAGGLDLDHYVAWPHVLVRTQQGVPSLVARALSAAGRERRVGLVVPSLLSVPHVVARTELLFTGPLELLAPLAGPLGLEHAPPPLPIPDVTVAAMWRSRLHADPGHRWCRERIAAGLQALLRAAWSTAPRD